MQESYQPLITHVEEEKESERSEKAGENELKMEENEKDAVKES